MKINDYKSAWLFPSCQIVVFNNGGFLIESCNTFINIGMYKDKSLFEVFPMLESLKKYLIGLRQADAPIHIPRVESYINDKFHVFDFVFIRAADNPNNLVWHMQNLTQQYMHLLKVQQERNEFYIRLNT